MRHLAGAVFAVALSGCALTTQLYPLQGPIAEGQPGTVISAYVLRGSISITLPDGETFDGPLGSVSPAQSGTDGVASAWDYVYGPGYYVAAVLGSPWRSRAVIKGSKGNTVLVELIWPSGKVHFQGVAKDTSGNIFKVIA